MNNHAALSSWSSKSKRNATCSGGTVIAMRTTPEYILTRKLPHSSFSTLIELLPPSKARTLGDDIGYPFRNTHDLGQMAGMEAGQRSPQSCRRFRKPHSRTRGQAIKECGARMPVLWRTCYEAYKNRATSYIRQLRSHFGNVDLHRMWQERIYNGCRKTKRIVHAALSSVVKGVRSMPAVISLSIWQSIFALSSLRNDKCPTLVPVPSYTFIARGRVHGRSPLRSALA